MNYPSLVSLREVAPRDGWQKFKTVLPTEVKRELICSMIDYGARELEIGVFSSDPVRGRQYQDLEPLCQAVLPYAAERGVKVTALVESVEAAQRARALGIRHVDFFLSVSDAFGQGFGSTPDRAFATLEAIANLPDLQVQAALGAVFGCPFGDATPLEKTLAYAQRAMELGPPPWDWETLPERPIQSTPSASCGEFWSASGQSRSHCTSTTLRDLVLPTA